MFVPTPMLRSNPITHQDDNPKAVAEWKARGGKSKGKKEPKDPNRPKKAATSYFCFTNEKRAGLTKEHPDLGVTEVPRVRVQERVSA